MNLPFLILCTPKMGGRPYILRHSDGRLCRYGSESAAEETAKLLGGACMSSFSVILDRNHGGF